uniref:RelA/SpoT domain-containing protein n=1 Tax=Chryseobacterium sp. B5 TaxID=2050562 RepID=A0A2G7T893_9FLAO
MNASDFKQLFMQKTKTTEEQQKSAESDLDTYKAIYEDYSSTKNDLEDVGEAYSKLLQKIPGVHSVRWRCKDPIGLIDKIIRKKTDDEEETRQKYADISKDNYKTLITDLVGVRALYFFKEDIDNIHSSLMRKLELKEEKPIYYHRKDDLTEIEKTGRSDQGFLIKEHSKGYRSIHYIAQGGIDRSNPAVIEIQVRSLFDEAWGEIDHKINYPAFDKKKEPANRPAATNIKQTCWQC